MLQWSLQPSAGYVIKLALEESIVKRTFRKCDRWETENALIRLLLISSFAISWPEVKPWALGAVEKRRRLPFSGRHQPTKHRPQLRGQQSRSQQRAASLLPSQRPPSTGQKRRLGKTRGAPMVSPSRGSNSTGHPHPFMTAARLPRVKRSHFEISFLPFRETPLTG
jgi:hypothetical protein